MANPAITVIKSFSYRGATEEWSNQYHLNAHPSNPSGWRDLVDALVDIEKTVYSSVVTVLRALCYDNADSDSVYTYILADYDGSVPGTFAGDDGSQMPGDVASWVRWATGDSSSTGKMIYLRKYFHDCFVGGGGGVDALSPDYKAALQAYGDALLEEIATGYSMATPSGGLPDGPAKAATYATTRTLHRRGRRP